MKRMRPLYGLAGRGWVWFVLVGLTGSPAALAQPAPFYSEPIVDSPELAPPGDLDVGYRVVSFTDNERPDIAAALQGSAGTASRTLAIHVWYPAQLAEGDEMRVEYTGRLPFPPGGTPEGAPTSFTFEGRAARDASPRTGTRYPLVVVSHGYGNWPTFLSYLTENLASKGYVVASIDHADRVAQDRAAFAFSFADVLLNRAKDQRFAMDQFAALAERDDPLGAIIDATSIGLIGYSMGGYGAITSAGAAYDVSSPVFQRLPEPLIDSLNASGSAPHPHLKAVVPIAPWGAQNPSRAWKQESVAAITVPTFFIAGDADDVSGFEGGIDWLYENAVGSRRRMLVYENARHNVGGNPPPPEAGEYFALQDWFDEPVWRRERITAINQHFVTAFLDLYLKADEPKRAYLDVAPPLAEDGVWPSQPGAPAGSSFSSGDQGGDRYWKGFHRRFALGLEMRSLEAKER